MGFRPTASTKELENDGQYARFKDFVKETNLIAPRGSWWDSRDAEQVRNLNSTLLVEAMASCTAITYVHGNLVGDPLDVQMFETTGWTLDESDQKTTAPDGTDQLVIAYTYPESTGRKKSFIPSSSSADGDGPGAYRSALIRRFDFSSSLQRMSTICKNDFDQGYRAFVKGSPEKISELCLAETLPRDFQKVLTEYTQEGYRVIALSYKELPLMTYRSA